MIKYEYDIEGYYYGSWEMVTCEETRKDALVQVRCYRENEPGTAFRIRKVKSEE